MNDLLDKARRGRRVALVRRTKHDFIREAVLRCITARLEGTGTFQSRRPLLAA